MHRHHVRGQHNDTRVPQRPQVHEQGVRGAGKGREGDDGLVSRLQAAPYVQRPRRHHNVLSHRSERGRQGREGVERPHPPPLREGVRRQGIHKEGTFRDALRPGHTPRPRNQGEHEEQADAPVGQDHAQEKVCHRVHKRATEEQGEHRALETPLRTQLHHEHLFGPHGLLLLRQQAAGVAGPIREQHAICHVLSGRYPELA